MKDSLTASRFRMKFKPNYIPHGNEENIFAHAFQEKIPVVLKGPTGCGKTRFIEHMAYTLDLPLITVSCHEDLTGGDLVGRFVFRNNETVWEDGPLTLAVRHGGLCYLDEIVEARNDTTVIIHSLTDDRRLLFIDKTREVLQAHEKFLMVLSYNPGYQNIMKDLKESTKQRFISLVFTHPDAQTEKKIIISESGTDEQTAGKLASLGEKIRNLKGYGLSEGVSTRLLVYAGRMIRSGVNPSAACRSAISDTLTDEQNMTSALADIINLHFPAAEEK